MPGKKSVVSLVLGSAFAVALGVAPVASAAENTVVPQSLTKGYILPLMTEARRAAGCPWSITTRTVE